MKDKLRVALVDIFSTPKAHQAQEHEMLSVRLLLENLSSESLFAISEPRCSFYDADRKRIFLGFCEPAVNDAVPPRWFTPPTLVKVGAQEKEEITAHIPKKLTQAVSSGKKLFERISYDITQAEELAVQVRYSHSPFQAIAAHALENARMLHDWGRPVDLSIMIKR